MMAIKRSFIWIPILLLMMGCEKIERPVYSNEFGRFVRFNLQVNKDGELVKPGEVNPAATVTDFFDQKTVQTLAIPVSLTSESLEEPVEVYFHYDTIGSFTDFTVTPEGVLTFSGSRLNDTIYVDYLSRWDASIENQLLFTLDRVSDDSIHLGNLNSLVPNTSLTINMGELFLRYSFPVNNSVEIQGEKGETVLISVMFHDGFFPDEVEDQELVIPDFKEFDYTLEQLPYLDSDNEISYLFTLNETLDDDLRTYQAGFTLGALNDYILSGNSTFSITKPENVPRDVSLNTAGHFYDLDDSFYRTYGELWMDYNNNDTCSWNFFSQFTYPVVVSQDHPNAVLYDDQGTLDPNDDVYHHAFRIGFNSPNLGRTTNSFNLKRWFENEYADSDESPGFNITQALEFYPDNDGTSATSGVVKVIPQELIIAGKQGDGSLVKHTLSIEGEGEYIEIMDGVFEITLELRATNMELFGGTRVAKYKIFNTSEYDDPVDLTEGCFKPMEL